MWVYMGIFPALKAPEKLHCPYALDIFAFLVPGG